MHASNFIEEVQYIPLKTNEENLIGRISKIILSSLHIYVHDNLSNNRFQFDREGNYLREIGLHGSGPNEYMKISTFSVNPINENITIYCEIKQSLFEFTSEGIPISENKIGFVCSDFIHYNGNYLFYGGRLPNQNVFNESFPKQYRMAVMKGDSVIAKYLPSEFNPSLLNTPITSNNNSLYTYHGTTRVVEKCTGYIYNIAEDVSPIYVFDFGEYTMPIDFYAGSSIDDNKIQVIEKGDYCRLFSLVEIDSYLYITYAIPENNMIFKGLYSKNSKEFFNLGPVWINDKDNVAMPQIVTTYGDDRLIGYYDAYDFKTMLLTNKSPLSTKMKSLSNSVEDSDNPIICIIKLK